MNKSLIFIFFSVFILYSCANEPDLSPIPTIKYLGPSKTIMRQGNLLQDTVLLIFEFEDGDGDLGFVDNTPSNRVFDLYILDKRTGKNYDQFILPTIPQQGTNNGIRGKMTVKIFNTCCTLQPCDPYKGQPNEALPLEVFIIDRAKNKSNVAQVDDLKLQCDI